MRLPPALSLAAVLAGFLIHHVEAFNMPTRRSKMTMMVGSLPNPFAEPEPTPSQPLNPVFISSDPADLDELDLSTPEGLISRAKIALSTDLGIRNGNILAENFVCIGPYLDKPLNKVDYLAAGRFFDLRSTFPDLDYRGHDYRVDRVDPFTVRLTARTVGTMRGELRLRDQTLPPNGQQMRCPPEAISMTFDPSTGKIVKLCTGFTMDRLVGNTNGLCGVMAAATVAGDPPSEWEIYPAGTVVQRFFGRPVAQIGESTSFLAPFPETVMVQLAKGILSSNMAFKDPSLLAREFTFMTPTKGPIAKKRFLEEFAEKEFEGVEPELSHFRVDPYDPNRVWVDVRPLAAGYEGPPQAMSFTFDDDGFCIRITTSYVMDPSLGNAGGLGGPEGYLYALGEASPGIATRPIPRAVGRLGKSLLSPITGSGVDDYNVEGFTLPRVGAKPAEDSPVETLSTIKAQGAVEATPPPPAPEKPKRKVPPPAPKPAAKPAPVKKAPTFSIPKMPTFSLGQEGAPAAKKPAPKKPAAKPAAVKKTVPKPKPTPKPVARKTPPKKAASKEAVPKSPSFSIPKIPTLSLSSPATPAAKKPAQATTKKPAAKKPAARKPPPKKPAPKKAPAKKKVPTKVAAPTFSIPKMPTLSLSSPQVESSTGSNNAAAAKKAEAQRRAAAEEKRQEQLKQQAEQKKQQEEARKAKAAEAAQAKKEAEEKRQADLKDKQAAMEEQRRQQAEAKKAVAEQRRQEADAQLELRKQEAAAAAEARKAEQERKNQEAAAAAEARKAEQERKKQEAAAAAEARKAEQERKQQEAAAKKQAAAEEAARKREEAQKKKAEEAARKQAEAQKKKAAAAASSAAQKSKQGATINLFGLGGESPAPAPKPAKSAPAPKPRPTINLFGGGQAPSPSPQKKAEETVKKAKPGATITLFGLGGGDNKPASKPSPAPAKAKQQRAAKAADTAQKAKPGATINLFGLGGGGESKPAPSKAKQASFAAKAAAKAPRGATINLFGLGGPAAPAKKVEPKKAAPKKVAPKKKATPVKKAASKPKPAKAKATAPKGVPTISGWKKNGDGSITGSIKGSPNFRSGERVTTSPISRGTVAAGNVVQTASGSKYFLS